MSFLTNDADKDGGFILPEEIAAYLKKCVLPIKDEGKIVRGQSYEIPIPRDNSKSERLVNPDAV